MAVIRATQLFVYKCAPNAALDVLPAREPDPVLGDETRNSGVPGLLPQPPDPRVYETVYTVPAGKRAILRSFQATLGAIPASTELEPNYWVQISGGALPGTYYVHWFWFVDHTGSQPLWQLTDSWEPMLVMHAGQRLAVQNVSTQFLSVIGSGHLLPEQT